VENGVGTQAGQGKGAGIPAAEEIQNGASSLRFLYSAIQSQNAR